MRIKIEFKYQLIREHEFQQLTHVIIKIFEKEMYTKNLMTIFEFMFN